MANHPIVATLQKVRHAHKLTQAALAEKAGMSRMSVIKVETGTTDPRLSTLHELARALGMELMLVPKALRPELEAFIRSGGKSLGQPAGVDAPLSMVDELSADRKN